MNAGDTPGGGGRGEGGGERHGEGESRTGVATLRVRMMLAAYAGKCGLVLSACIREGSGWLVRAPSRCRASATNDGYGAAFSP